MARYADWNSAESGHAEMVETARRHIEMEKAGLEQIKAGYKKTTKPKLLFYLRDYLLRIQ